MHRASVTRVTSIVLIAVGAALLLRPGFEDLVGQWHQYRRASLQDVETLTYRNGLAAAYRHRAEVVRETRAAVEDPVVSFEIGAQPAPAEHGRVAAALTLPSTRIRIPAIGLDQAVVEGIDRSNLAEGPGHYPGTALPGASGNVVISGHRTTYTHPFRDLDALDPGDVVLLDLPERTLTYQVESVSVRELDDIAPLAATDHAKLTLTTCHPIGSARQRLVVEARLLP